MASSVVNKQSNHCDSFAKTHLICTIHTAHSSTWSFGFSPTAAFYSLPHPSGLNKMVLLLHKLLLNVLPLKNFLFVIEPFFNFMFICCTYWCLFSSNFQLYCVTVLVFVFALVYYDHSLDTEIPWHFPDDLWQSCLCYDVFISCQY